MQGECCLKKTAEMGGGDAYQERNARVARNQQKLGEGNGKDASLQLPKYQLCGYPDLRSPVSRILRQEISLKPSSIYYFVIIPLAN